AGEARALAEAGASADEVAARLVRLRRRFAEVGAIDFFGASGRETVEGLLSGLEARLREAAGAAAPTAGEGECFDRSPGRTWVTRARVGIDRMASAWLIRRFIDPEARFKFVAAAGYRPRRGEVRFDMFEAEYTHVGDRCTFEVLVERAGLSDLGLRRIGEIVHDVDIKDDKFGRPETPGIAQVVAGIAASQAGDMARLERAFALFDDLLATTGAKRPRRAAARRRAR
ncbi:MAG TPA: chromate resistance protein ChrB domain-containing protein, partial [Dongiaceae bacterium]|nr:chromate resistance protein ChrB domain-containing protein [Dongiaceae bacterium]